MAECSAPPSHLELQQDNSLDMNYYFFLFIGPSTLRAGSDGIQHDSAAALTRVKPRLILCHLAFCFFSYWFFVKLHDLKQTVLVSWVMLYSCYVCLRKL